MRQVFIFTGLALGTLLACPQQRLPTPLVPAPQPPSVPNTVMPRGIDKPPALNPGNIAIDVRSNENNLTHLPDNADGIPQYRLNLTTGANWPWQVTATSTSQRISTNDIILDSFPNYPPVNSKDIDGHGKVTDFWFYLPYKEGQKIMPMVLTIVARNTRHCRLQVRRSRAGDNAGQGQGVAVSDVPKSEADCNTINISNSIFNFDQKVQLHLHVENVMSRVDKINQEYTREIHCAIFNRAIQYASGKIQATWGSSNDIKGTLVNLGADLIEIGIRNHFAIKNITCDDDEQQQEYPY